MAPRKRKETPKVEVKEEESEEYGRIVPEAALRIINRLDEQVQDKVDGLLATRAALQQAVRESFQLQLIKLPKQVRDMPLKQFKEEYGGDITSVLLQDMEQRLAASSTQLLPATSLRTRAKGAASVMPTQRRTRAKGAGTETPAVGMLPPRQAGTIMRVPKGNELLYSANGSPLGILEQRAGQAAILRTNVKGQSSEMAIAPLGGNTVLQQARPGSRTGVADSLSITLKSGEQVQIDFDGGLDNVAEHQQDEVKAHLSALQKFATSLTGGRRRR